MENLRVQKKDIYKIQVNNKGEYIEFDLADISLRAKCYDALDELENIAKSFEEKYKTIETDKELAHIEKEMFEKMRNAMDVFLGKGACQKIFGDRNYYEMFNDLIKELNKKRPELNGKSHMDMLELNSEKIKNRIISKYAKNSKNVI